MATFKINRVTSLPGTPETNSIYLVTSATDFVEMYVTGNTTTPRRLYNESDIQALIDTALAGISSMEIAADITARDALGVAATANLLVLVLDASADATVTSGAATYAYDNGLDTWTKISEAESQDVILQWANITGGPSSSPAAIDSAVSNSHTHTNKTQLDKVDENGDGDFTYNGQEYVQSGTITW